MNESLMKQNETYNNFIEEIYEITMNKAAS